MILLLWAQWFLDFFFFIWLPAGKSAPRFLNLPSWKPELKAHKLKERMARDHAWTYNTLKIPKRKVDYLKKKKKNWCFPNCGTVWIQWNIRNRITLSKKCISARVSLQIKRAVLCNRVCDHLRLRKTVHILVTASCRTLRVWEFSSVMKGSLKLVWFQGGGGTQSGSELLTAVALCLSNVLIIIPTQNVLRTWD